ncbi:MAG: hydrogenase iron-sulfur subunit [bacterium]|jgi:Coenzyme F420-reducing hydrogenase, delta subunit
MEDMNAEKEKQKEGTAATNAGSQSDPRLIAFVCNWCTYNGADLAGTSRMKYSDNVRVIKLPCTGRIDPLFIVEAFKKGAKGVLVSGCHPGDCHYTSGNYHSRRKYATFRDLLGYLGVDLNRVEFSWISASEGNKWVAVINEFTDKIKSLPDKTTDIFTKK